MTDLIPVFSQVDRATAEVRGLVETTCPCADPVFCSQHNCWRRLATSADKPTPTHPASDRKLMGRAS